MNKYYLFPLMCTILFPIFTRAQDPGGAAGSTGTVTGTYRGSSVTYTTVRAKDGWVWLRQNLGSTQVATSATDEASYGDLFQWGRWDDGHQVRTPENVVDGMPTPNNPSGLNLSGDNPFYKGGGITWYDDGTVGDKWAASAPANATATNGCDPCRQIFGAGWQLPSLADWQTVLEAEGANNIATGFASNLRLNAPGTRNYLLGSLADPGVTSEFWSSTAESDSAPQAMYINLANGNLADYNYRGIGMSIRCLKKSLPTSIKENKTGASFQLYPNPAQNYVLLHLDTDGPIAAELQVTNILGCQVFRQKINAGRQPVSVSVTDLPDGTYFLSVSTKQYRQVKPFTIRH